jgi:hypothetical protein
LRKNEDGTILLEPVTVAFASAAQDELDATPELRELLAVATSAATIRRTRLHRTWCAYIERDVRRPVRSRQDIAQ